MKEELLKGLTEEQFEKARACKSNEELLELAKEEGLELNDEQLAAIAGGVCEDEQPQNYADPNVNNGPRCPKCGSANVIEIYDSYYSEGLAHRCNNCGTIWG